jgi:hypothetical protein
LGRERISANSELRVSGSSAGNYIIDTLRVGSTWAEVTPLGQISPATRLVFATAPTAGTAGAALASTVVQIQNADIANIGTLISLLAGVGPAIPR